MKIRVQESSRGKVPSKYVNKVFELVFCSRVRNGDATDRGPYKLDGFDSYTGKTKSGKTLHFMKLAGEQRGPVWFVRQEDCCRGTWLFDVEEME